MRFVSKAFVVGIFYFFISISPVGADSWAEKIERLKPSVVNLKVTSQMGLFLDDSGEWGGTGFIVDATRGIIATNHHVTSSSPAHITINFIDGSSTEGKVLYYDPSHDFAFIQFDVSSVNLELQQVKLGSSFDLKLQEDVLLIGNMELEEYSVKLGRVVNLVVDKGDRHSATIHTSIDRAGGASGSPVWNINEEVIGIHYKGSDVASFELRIEYIKDALEAIQRGEKPSRGDIGAVLHFMMLDDSIRYLSAPKEFKETYKKNFPDSTKVITISRATPNSSSENILKPGDIVLSVEGQLIGNNMYLFDKLVNQKVGQNIRVTVLRSDGEHSFDLPVHDMEQQKIKRFVRVCGATFHEVNSEMRQVLDYHGDGVYLARSEDGGPFNIGEDDAKTPTLKKVVILEIGGTLVHNLDDFINAAENLKDNQPTFVIYSDLYMINKAAKLQTITFDPTFGPLQVFIYDEETHTWEEEQK